MRIDFLVNYVHGGWKPTDKRLGGTEESVVEWAKELSRRGHQTIVYDNDTRDLYTGDSDITINVKSWDTDPKGPTLYLTNETNASDLDLSKYLGVIWPSKWARDNIPVNNKTFILPHGYNSKEIYPGKKVPKQCLYASSPDRGLDTLLRAWPSVLVSHPDATLIVTYGAQLYDIPGVTYLDATEQEMNELYRTSDIWAYPCSGGELYCMTGIKAQAAGCVPVIIPTMALVETVKVGYIAHKDNYAERLIYALGDNREGYREALVKENYPDWQDSTDRLLEIIEEVLR